MINYETNLCKKCQLHGGFLRSYRKLTEKGLDKAIANVVKTYPSYGLIFTGHSLGGAVAVIAAVKFNDQNSGKAVKVYTFGQPRVGDGDYAKYVDSKLNYFFQVSSQEGSHPS